MADQTLTKHKLNDPKKWVYLYSDKLYRYAFYRINIREIAEDLVQETLLSALKSIDQYRGESAELSWLISILKYKIIDYLRYRYKQNPVNQSDIEKIDIGHLFDDNHSCHINSPSNWVANPSELFEKKEFWKIFEMCLELLTPLGAQAFTLREIENMNTVDISNILNITKSNLYVILHRSRLILRDCMDKNWVNI